MASLGLDLGDDDVHAAELATCVRAARVHCVVHSGGDLHAIHTAVRVMLGAARTRTGDRRHALYRRRHTGHDMVEWRLHEAIAVYTLHARSPAPVRRDGLWRRTSTRPTAPSAAARPAPTCAVAAGRQGSRRGAPRVGTWWTRHRHVASALLCKARFTDLRFHRTDAFRVAEEDTGTHPPGWVPRKNQAFSDLPGSRGNGKKLDESLLVRIDYFFSSSEFATRLPVHRPPRAESEEHEVHGLVHSARGRHGIAAEVA